MCAYVAFDADDHRDEPDGYFGRRRSIQLPLQRLAIVYLRQSSYEQLKKRRHSLEMQADLRRIAIEDFGYPPDKVLVVDKDLGISGTLSEEDRPGLADTLRLIRQGQVEAIFVVKPDRLYRDQTLVGPIDFALDCQKHDTFVAYLGWQGPTLIDFNNDEDFENWIKMCQESAKELKSMQVRMGGARFYKAKSGKYAGGSIHWGWRFDHKNDCIVAHEPHLQTVLNILRVAAECTSLRQVLNRVRDDPACWFRPFEGEDLIYTYPRHIAGRAKMPVDQPWMFKSIYQVQALLTHAGYVGIRLYGSGPGAQKKVNAKMRKQKRGKVRTRLRIKPHFFGVFPEEALLRSPEEQALFWDVQERFNSIDLRSALETEFKHLPRNPDYQWPERGSPQEVIKNAYARLVFCGQHGLDPDSDFVLSHRMRAWVGGVWGCRKDWDLAVSATTCTNIRSRLLERILDTHIRFRLQGGQNHLEDLVQLIEHHQQQEAEHKVMLQHKLANVRQAVDNYAAQLNAIDVRTDVGRFLFAELQQRLSPLLAEKQLLEVRLSQEQSAVRRTLDTSQPIPVREALQRISKRWANIDSPTRNRLLSLVVEHIVVTVVPGTRTVLLRFRWRDGHDDWCLAWYWGERNNAAWETWEDEALRQFWKDEKSARTILAALRPGRRWGTVRVRARQLGLRAAVKRPDVAAVKLEQDRGRAPTDESKTLVYYFLGRFPKGEWPEVERVQEMHEEAGKVWAGRKVSHKISVSTLLSLSVPFAVPTATSTRMPASTT